LFIYSVGTLTFVGELGGQYKRTVYRQYKEKYDNGVEISNIGGAGGGSVLSVVGGWKKEVMGTEAGPDPGGFQKKKGRKIL